MTIFRADTPAHDEQIRKAIAPATTEALRQAAHALKGSLGTLDAPRAFHAAVRVEESARSGDLSAARPLVDALSAS